MKYLLTGPILFLLMTAGAQPSREIIRKYRIDYYQEYHSIKTDDDEKSHLSIWRFDKNGNDSLLLKGYDTLSVNYEYQNGKQVRRQYVNFEGKEKERYDYQYQPDGGYQVTYTNGYLGNQNSYEWYDRRGRLLKSKSPGGITTINKYNASGKILSLVSGGKGKEAAINHTYSYNKQGRLVGEDKKANANHTIIRYVYNAKGQIVSHIEKGIIAGGKFESKVSYQYNDKGLLSRKDTRINKGEDDDWEEIYDAYEYKYY